MQPRGRYLVKLVIGGGLVGGAVAAVSPYALAAMLLDAPWVLAVLLPGVALGHFLLPVLRLGPVSRSWHFLLTTGLGVGWWSNVILGLGLLGALDRRLFVGLAGAAAVYLVLRWRQRGPGRGALDQVALEPAPVGYLSYEWLWLWAAPFLTLGLLAAANAPGFLWKEEGFGYDVLEYHLQLPREYWADGFISYRSHNVYANFPANVEMLYLAAMVLTGSPQDSGTICQWIHLILGGLAVGALWRAGCAWSPRAGIVAGVTAATAGWFAYLSGLAYVELGMLNFGALAMACLVRAYRENEPWVRDGEGAKCARAKAPTSECNDKDHTPNRWGWIAASGLFAGLACGCKYTAVPLLAGPLWAAALVLAPGRFWKKLQAGGVFTVACVAAFSPWLVKNAVMTGNPVFPLAQRLFHANPPGWGDEETQRWNHGHYPRTDKAAFNGRLAALWRNLPGDHDQRFGPAIFVLGLGGLLLRKPTRADVSLLVILGLQVIVWMLATHLFARFAVVFLIPLSLLCGRMVDEARGRFMRGVAVAVITVGAGWNFAFAARRHAAESPGGAPAALFYEGEVPGFEYFGYINRELPPAAKLLLIGDARPFYVRRHADYSVVFNRNPFAEVVRSGNDAAAVLEWLRQEGYTHLLVHWPEIERLRRTYGFADEINTELFDRLQEAGLKVDREFTWPGMKGKYVNIYRLIR